MKTVTISGIKNLANSFDKRKKKIRDVEIQVGYTAAYALYVHEMGSTRSGQPKFLEKPIRDLHNSGEFKRLLKASLKAGNSFTQSLVTLGQRLQRESQKIVPVDTGNLKASAFTRKIKG